MRLVAVLLVLTTSAAPAPTLAGSLPPMRLHFIRNVGQADARVGFLVKGAGPDLYFATDEIVLREPPGACGDGSVVRLRFEDASPAMRLEGLDTLPGVAHFYLGNRPENWRENVPMHAGVAYRGAWPGIDALYGGSDGRLKAEFHVEPGADPRRIRLAFTGVTELRLRRDGALVIETPTGELVEEAPVAWEDGPSGRRAVTARFVLLGGNRVGFDVENRDPASRLVLDPVLDYSTYVGGSDAEDVTWVGEAHGDDVTVYGRTRSPDFPSISGSPPSPGSWDAYYLTADLRESTYSVLFLGGSGDESPTLHGGTTFSPDLPVTRGAFQRTYGGAGDAYIMTVDATSPLEVSYLGGSGFDEALGGGGMNTGTGVSRCLVGRTFSADFPTPLEPGVPDPFDRILDGPSDGFVACSVAGPFPGLGRVRATLIGGAGDDAATGLWTSTGGARVVGWTESADFPRGSVPGLGTGLNGPRDAFVADMAIDHVATTSLLGGSGRDEARFIDESVVGGSTDSADFPLARPTQAALGGGTDGWVAVLGNASPATLVFSTYVGGSGDESVEGGGWDRENHLMLAGTTTSNDLPLVMPVQARLLGASDAFAVEINPSSAPPRINWSTYLGGPGADEVTAAAASNQGCLVLGGRTDGSGFPERRGFQPAPGGGQDGFIARLCETDVLRQGDPAEQLVEVLERLERIETSIAGLDLTDVRESLARLEDCCGATQRKLDDLLDFTDDATARLGAIEDELSRLRLVQQDALLRDIEESLFEKRCVPWLWLPEAEGHLRLARDHVARRIDQAVASNDPRVNVAVARARLEAADADAGHGAWQDACKRLSDALHGLTSP